MSSDGWNDWQETRKVSLVVAVVMLAWLVSFLIQLGF